MSDTSDDDRQRRIELYRQLNERMSEVYRDNVRFLDNRVLALSAGALALSLTFITTLADMMVPWALPLLLASWVLLAGAIVAVLAGLRWATKLSTQKESLDTAHQAVGVGKYENPNPEAARKRNELKNARIDCFNAWSFWLFACGLAAMLVFVLVCFAAQGVMTPSVEAPPPPGNAKDW